MSILKTGVALLLLVLVGVYELKHLSDQGLHIPTLGNKGLPSPPSTGQVLEPAVDGLTVARPEDPPRPIVTKSLPLSDGPRVAPAAKLYPAASGLSGATSIQYKDVLAALEIDGCFPSGAFAAKVDGAQPVTIHTGETVKVAGLRVKLKLIAYPSCRVQVFDGNRAFGEVAAL